MWPSRVERDDIEWCFDRVFSHNSSTLTPNTVSPYGDGSASGEWHFTVHTSFQARQTTKQQRLCHRPFSTEWARLNSKILGTPFYRCHLRSPRQAAKAAVAAARVLVSKVSYCTKASTVARGLESKSGSCTAIH